MDVTKHTVTLLYEEATEENSEYAQQSETISLVYKYQGLDKLRVIYSYNILF